MITLLFVISCLTQMYNSFIYPFLRQLSINFGRKRRLDAGNCPNLAVVALFKFLRLYLLFVVIKQLMKMKNVSAVIINETV